jgi:uncharacterized protein involved in exopolysaccharide biosynthesis
MSDNTARRLGSDEISEADGPSIRHIAEVFWRDRRLTVPLALLCGLVASAVVLLLPRKYAATVLLSAVSTQSNPGGLGSLSSMLSQFGGLATLAGLSVQGGGSAKAEALATLQSGALTRRFIDENKLLPVLFSSKWDAKQGRWKVFKFENVPTLWKGNELFARRIREVSENTRNGLISLKITWTDPRASAAWANGLVKLTNSYLRDRAIDESSKNIAYLNSQAEQTKLVVVRDAIYLLMEGEIKKQMLARGSEEYALKVIDPAVVAERPTSPHVVLWILASFLVSTSGATVIALMREKYSTRGAENVRERTAGRVQSS